jgi:hypothetical protein
VNEIALIPSHIMLTDISCHIDRKLLPLVMAYALFLGVFVMEIKPVGLFVVPCELLYIEVSRSCGLEADIVVLWQVGWRRACACLCVLVLALT